jgi:hypothetical protein
MYSKAYFICCGTKLHLHLQIVLASNRSFVGYLINRMHYDRFSTIIFLLFSLKDNVLQVVTEATNGSEDQSLAYGSLHFLACNSSASPQHSKTKKR